MSFCDEKKGEWDMHSADELSCAYGYELLFVDTMLFLLIDYMLIFN